VVKRAGALIEAAWVDLGLRYGFEHLPAGFNRNIKSVSPRIEPSASFVQTSRRHIRLTHSRFRHPKD